MCGFSSVFLPGRATGEGERVAERTGWEALALGEEPESLRPAGRFAEGRFEAARAAFLGVFTW